MSDSDYSVPQSRKIKPLDASVDHWKKMKNSEYIGHWDIPEDRTEIELTIESVNEEEIRDTIHNEDRDVFTLSFVKAKKRLILNETNKGNIAQVHGVNPHGWAGKKIIIIKSKDRGKDCLRVKPQAVVNRTPSDPTQGFNQ